jgi:hypothetical protein
VGLGRGDSELESSPRRVRGKVLRAILVGLEAQINAVERMGVLCCVMNCRAQPA